MLQFEFFFFKDGKERSVECLEWQQALGDGAGDCGCSD